MEFPDIMAIVDPNTYMYYFFDEMKCWGKNIVHGDIAFAVIDMIFFEITEKMFGPHYPNKVVPKLVKEIDPYPIVHSILNDLIDDYLKEQVYREKAILTDEPIQSIPVAYGIVEDLV